jgi:hypothetical protein
MELATVTTISIINFAFVCEFNHSHLVFQSIAAEMDRQCAGEVRLDDDRVQMCAKLYIWEYGPNAVQQAERNVTTLRNQGDETAAETWSRVVTEIGKLAGVVRIRPRKR